MEESTSPTTFICGNCANISVLALVLGELVVAVQGNGPEEAQGDDKHGGESAISVREKWGASAVVNCCSREAVSTFGEFGCSAVAPSGVRDVSADFTSSVLGISLSAKDVRK